MGYDHHVYTDDALLNVTPSFERSIRKSGRDFKFTFAVVFDDFSLLFYSQTSTRCDTYTSM